MAVTATKLPVKNENRGAMPTPRHPLETLQKEIDRLFNDFSLSWPFRRSSSFGLEPFWQSDAGWGAMPAVDVAEKDKAYEITAELPGMDEKDVELTMAGDTLTITGEKHEEKEEKQKDFYLSERRYGSFRRAFLIPDDVDTDKIDASFRKGVLTVMLPRKAGAEKPQKRIAVKSA